MQKRGTDNCLQRTSRGSASRSDFPASHTDPSGSITTSYSSLSTRCLSERSRRFYTPVSESRTSRKSSSASSLPRLSRGACRRHSSESNNSSGDGTDRLVAAATQPVADPQRSILTFIMHSTSGRVGLAEVASYLNWDTHYKDLYGDLREFLLSYQSVFHPSPVDDTVTLQPAAVMSFERRRLLTTERGRRRVGKNYTGDIPRFQSPESEGNGGTGTDGDTALFDTVVGSISYANVAESFDLDVLAKRYQMHGFEVRQEYDVLHVAHRARNTAILPAAEAVTNASFDLFLFPTGSVVWWGTHRYAHTIVERDFLHSQATPVNGVRNRHSTDVIEELFPAWCTFEVEPGVEARTAATRTGEGAGLADSVVERDAPPRDEDIDAALVRFSQRLQYEHYILPANATYRAQVMLVVSHCLARSARVDYYEHITQKTHHSVLSITGDFKNLVDYFSTKKTIDRLSGELLVAQLAVKTLRDSPEFLWEMPWLQAFYDITDAQYASEDRLSWFCARSDAYLTQLASVKGRRFRLFMLGSDVFLIVLLILDVVCMTVRLVGKLYFRLPED